MAVRGPVPVPMIITGVGELRSAGAVGRGLCTRLPVGL